MFSDLNMAEIYKVIVCLRPGPTNGFTFGKSSADCDQNKRKKKVQNCKFHIFMEEFAEKMEESKTILENWMKYLNLG
jgi:hypothetical protein